MKGNTLYLILGAAGMGISAYMADESYRAALSSRDLELVVLTATLSILFLLGAVICLWVAYLFAFRLLDVVAEPAGDFAFIKAAEGTTIEFKALRVVKLIGGETSTKGNSVSHVILVLDGSSWLLRGVERDPGVLRWLEKRGGKKVGVDVG